MPDIKLRDGSGVETTYNDVNTITVPLADGSGQQVFTKGDWYDGILTIPTSTICYCSGPMGQKIVDLFWDDIVIGTPSTPIIDWQRLFDGVKKIDASDKSIYISGNATNGDGLATKFPMKYHFDNLGGYGMRNGPISNKYGLEEGIIAGWSEVPDNMFYKIWTGADCLAEYLYSCESVPARWLQVPKYFDPSNYSSYGNYKNVGSSWNPYYYMFGDGYTEKAWRSIDGLEIIPMDCNGTVYVVGPCLHTVKFVTDNGTPRSASWNNMTLKFGYNNGQQYFIGFSYNGQSVYPRSKRTTTWGTTFSDHIITNETEYQLYKDEADKVVKQGYQDTYTNSVTGESERGYFGILFSNYNHDSMVETINSLPDLTEAGTACTISFATKLGKLTNEGGFDKLTEQEIAVAVAKGWTVASHTN